MVGAPELQAQIERERRGSLMAWDVRAKKVAWQVEQKLPISGGTLATAGNLVFQGAADGRLVAYAADSGKVLWEITTYGSMPGGTVTYSVRGQQYVAVGIGWGGAFPGMFADGAVLAGYTNPSRIAVWRLDGQGKLPPPALRQAKVAPPPMTAPIERVMLGVTLFATHCGFCHGPGFGASRTWTRWRRISTRIFRPSCLAAGSMPGCPPSASS
jgi:quinohemoprotein ethanol dehydrogenase